MSTGLRWKVTKAVRASDLAAPARLIMLTLADIADVGTAEIPEQFTPSLSVLARETGLARSTVAAHLLGLEHEGWIVRTRPATESARAMGDRTRYQLAIPGNSAAAPVQEDDQPSPTQGPPGPGDGPEVVRETDQGSPGDGLYIRSSSDQEQEPSSSELRPDVEKVCRHLADRIVDNGSKRPTVTKAWRDAARLLIDNDKRTVEQVIRAIDWCQTDEFWRGNILSMPTLRKQYERLRLAAGRPTNGARASPSTAPQKIPPDQRCPHHRGQPIDDCAGCAADARARPRSPT